MKSKIQHALSFFWNAPWLIYTPVVLRLLLHHRGGVESVTLWAAKLKTGPFQESVGPGLEQSALVVAWLSPRQSPRSPADATTSHQVALWLPSGA